MNEVGGFTARSDKVLTSLFTFFVTLYHSKLFCHIKRDVVFNHSSIVRFHFCESEQSLVFRPARDLLHKFVEQVIRIFHELVFLNTVLNPSGEVLSRVGAYSRRGRPFSEFSEKVTKSWFSTKSYRSLGFTEFSVKRT